MSEKLFSLLLRLYPAAFRKDYREEALQLLRDRFRDEQGFFPRLRLWCDLLPDLAVSIPRGYRGRQPALLAASAQRHLDGTPSFRMIEGESPRPAAFFFGTAAALVAVAIFSIALGQAGNYRPLRIRGASHPSAHNPKWPSSSAPGQRSPAAGEEGAGAAQSAVEALPAQAQDQTRKSPPTAAGSPALDAAERKLVIREIVTNLKQHYVSSKATQGVADGLRAHEKSGDYDAITDSRGFAILVTHQMRDLSHDPRLSVEYSPTRLPDHPGPPLGAMESYRAAMQQENCMFRKAEILPHNIGYLKLDAFPDLSICQSTAAAAMASVNNAGAIIFDLRENSGGYPEMVSFVAAYLFDHPVYLFNPRETTSARSWTASPVPGSRLADKPVYILTSASTFSGAEEFAYNLKMLKRATLVGETTRGGEHAGVWRRIDDHFGMGIPETQPVNPYSKTGWEGTGIEPDVKVKAAEALKTAENLAKSQLEKK